MSEFLPKDYSTPETSGHYMKLEEGDNTFRVIGSAIVGWEYWIDDTDNPGKRKPVRVMTWDELPEKVKNVADRENKANHFWAFLVFNRATETIQILEITQKGIQKSIEALVKGKDWGDPKNYDITITRTKTGSNPFDVEYNVRPEPKEPLETGVKAYVDEMVKKVKVNLLYEGKNPFEALDEADITDEDL